MLTRLTVRRFKSLRDVTIELPRLAVLFGPNAAGKSNLLDALQALSWMGTARTLFDALGGPLPVRGYAFEAFSFASGGLPEMVRRGSASFTLEADLSVEREDTAIGSNRSSISGQANLPLPMNTWPSLALPDNRRVPPRSSGLVPTSASGERESRPIHERNRLD